MIKYHTNELPGRTVNLEDGKEFLYFSGTDYLGMGHNEAFRIYLNDGFKLYGNHYGSSRNNSLQLNIYQEAEKALSNYTKAPSALTVSSGMWAGQLVMKEIENVISILTLPKSFSQICYHYAPKVHPALWGNDYVSTNLSWVDWAFETIQVIQGSHKETTHIICSDSVGSPWVQAFDFSVFNALSKRNNIYLIVDDSHGLGVTGQSGNGIFQQLIILSDIKVIVVASLNKAMGIPAGVILADENITSIISKSPWFSGASPCIPAYAFALKKFLGTKSYQETFEKMLLNVRYFQAQTAKLDLFTSLPDYPVFCSKNTLLFQFFVKNGIMASSFSYPLATDLPVTRLAISALHQKEDLDKLAEVCTKFQSEN